MSWDNLATALHDNLCEPLGCVERFEESSYEDHGLSREWWHKVAEDVQVYVKAVVAGEWPEWIANNLRSHSFPKCAACGAAIDDPEASAYCEWDVPA